MQSRSSSRYVLNICFLQVTFRTYIFNCSANAFEGKFTLNEEKSFQNILNVQHIEFPKSTLNSDVT